MKTDFSQPRFTGTRFDEHTLPVDVARDLVAYETLIVELAKHLYLKEHPDRQRVPKGFTSNFHLDIKRIDEGSASPMLALVLSGTLALSGGERDCFEQARDLIADCIAAPENALPADFPKELLVHFNQLGRSLRDGEAMELSRPNTASATLTPEKRKRLVLAADRVYEKEVDLLGSIAEVDWEKSTFRLRLADGGQVNVPMQESFHNKAREFGGKARHQVTLKGVAAYDSWDRLQKLVFVESLEIVKNHAIATRMDELAQLQAGWFEGGGLAPDVDKLSSVSEKLIAEYPDKLLLLPQITPKQDGNLLLEWEAVGDPSLDIDLNALQASFHAFDANGEDVEHDFNLDSAGWQTLFAFLSENIKAQQE
jgi:hypothetical protein